MLRSRSENSACSQGSFNTLTPLRRTPLRSNMQIGGFASSTAFGRDCERVKAQCERRCGPWSALLSVRIGSRFPTIRRPKSHSAQFQAPTKLQEVTVPSRRSSRNQEHRCASLSKRVTGRGLRHVRGRCRASSSDVSWCSASCRVPALRVGWCQGGR